MKIPLFPSILTLSLAVLWSCGCDEPISALDSRLYFSVYDNYTGRDILLDNVNLEIYNESGELVSSLASAYEVAWSVSGGIPLWVLEGVPNRTYNSLIERKFYLTFEETDTDTLYVNSYLVQNDCESSSYQTCK